MSSNSLLYNRDAVPQFSSPNPRCTVISHREFIRDIRSSIDFESTTLTINPGDPVTFPWLHQIAENFEEYIFQGLVFEYKTNSATAVSSTNTAMGTVCMATQYNSLAPDFTSKHQIENYEFSNSAVPSESFLHAIECDPKLGNDVKYVFNERDSKVNADPRMYNLGKTTIGTQGMQAASTIGELWVTYKICFMKPRLGYDDNYADCYRIPVANIAAATPMGGSASLPSLQNINFTSQSTVDLKQFLIEPGFSGVIRVELAYTLSSATEFQAPQIEMISGNNVNVTDEYTGGDETKRPVLTGLAAETYIIQAAYFNVLGGYDENGDQSVIQIDSMDTTAAVFTHARLNIMAVPSSSVFPVFT